METEVRDATVELNAIRRAVGLVPIEQSVVSHEDLRVLIGAADVLRRVELVVANDVGKQQCRTLMREIQAWVLAVGRDYLGLLPPDGDGGHDGVGGGTG